MGFIKGKECVILTRVNQSSVILTSCYVSPHYLCVGIRRCGRGTNCIIMHILQGI